MGPSLGCAVVGVTHRTLCKAKSNIVQLCPWHAAPSDRCPDAPVFIRPTAAPQRSIIRIASGIDIVPAPLPHVAKHVKEPETVGVLESNRLRAIDPIVVSPGDLRQWPITRSCRAGPASPLPFSLCGEAKAVGAHMPPHVSSANHVGRSETKHS